MCLMYLVDILPSNDITECISEIGYSVFGITFLRTLSTQLTLIDKSKIRCHSATSKFILVFFKNRVKVLDLQ